MKITHLVLAVLFFTSIVSAHEGAYGETHENHYLYDYPLWEKFLQSSPAVQFWFVLFGLGIILTAYFAAVYYIRRFKAKK